jgi:hypothetical protein
MEGHIVGMGNGGKKLKYTPSTQGRVYSDNTKVVTPTPTSPLPTAKTDITTLAKDKAYQLPKYESKKEINPTVKKLLNSADMATDVLQLGHFSPDPFMIGQTAGLIGDVVGAGVDAIQSGIDVYEGNYGNAALNLGLSVLPGQTKKLGYERSSSLLTGKGSGMYRPLTATTPALAQNPVIKKGLNWNRGTLAANLTELGSNTGLPNMPTTNAQTQKEYQDNLKTAPILKNPEMKKGGMADKTITCSKCGWSWKASEGGLNPLSCHKCGGVAKMPNGGSILLEDYDKTMAPKQGNYLLPDINRPSYIDSEGGRRSEYKMGFNIDGKETLLPTVVNGKQLTNDEAVQRYKDTGLNMGKYENPIEAEYYSRLRTARYNMLEDPIRFTSPEFKKGGKVDHRNDDDMVNGVASILRRVKDKKNRLQLANQLSNQFNREKVKYSLNDFLNKSKVKK